MSGTASSSLRISRVDALIFAMMVFAPAALLVGLALSHSHHGFVAMVAYYSGVGGFVALPLVTAVHIFRNRAAPLRLLLWIESVAVGLLVALVVQSFALNYLGDTAASCVSFAAGAAFAMLPFFVRARS
jgi:hypothetical protein